MACFGNLRDCLRSVGWLKTSTFVVTLASVYAAALVTFVGIAVGDLPTIIFKQPLQHHTSPPADLTKSPDFVGTLQLSAVGVDTPLNQFSFSVSFFPSSRMMEDATGALVEPVRFEVQGQTVLYANASASWSVPRRLPALQGRDGHGKLVLYVTSIPPGPFQFL